MGILGITSQVIVDSAGSCQYTGRIRRRAPVAEKYVSRVRTPTPLRRQEI